MIYVKICLNVGGCYIQKQDGVNILLDEIENAIYGKDLDSIWTVSLVEMNEEEYAAIPEFTGH